MIKEAGKLEVCRKAGRLEIPSRFDVSVLSLDLSSKSAWRQNSFLFRGHQSFLLRLSTVR